MKNAVISVAIDGPAGAGKTSLAKAVAKAAGLTYIDTGAMYRTTGLYMLRQGIDLADAEGVSAALPTMPLRLHWDENGVQHVFLGDDEVSDRIREPDIASAGSAVSKIPAVREKLVALQQGLAKTQSVVMEGRDIGTTVLPNAAIKLFVTASPEVRARRRFLENQARGIPGSYEEVLAAQIERDRNDSSRACSPLRQADDAILLDTSDMTFEAVLTKALSLIRSAGGKNA